MQQNTSLKYKGANILTQEYVQSLRDADRKRPNHLMFAAQKGAQERILASDADITICGGSRGGSKSFSLLMEGLYDIQHPNFNAILLRNEKPDLESLIRDSKLLYSQFGEYHTATNDMAWHLNNGGKISFWFYSGDYENKFKKKFQGQQYAYVGIDEITHCPFDKFKYLLTCNRNAHHIRNRFIGTCNPDPDSWVRKFIDWWIGEDGYPIPERDGVIRYCFMDGDTVSTIYWGDTPEEVYEQCKHIIDPLWERSKEQYEALGYDKYTAYTKSVAFVRAAVEENVKLVSSDPSYLANLAQQSEEQRMRDLDGNWNWKSSGDDLLSIEDMENFFTNARQTGDGIKRAASDIALTGGDLCVTWLMVGNHVQDVMALRYKDAKYALEAIKRQLNDWGVLEENYAYDGAGVGQFLDGYMKKAVKFGNQDSPKPDGELTAAQTKDHFRYYKDQCANKLVELIKQGEISINPALLDKTFSGKGYTKMPLRQILLQERKALKWRDSESGKKNLITKEEMKKLIGHSPDWMESLLYTCTFKFKVGHKRAKGLWMI